MSIKYPVQTLKLHHIKIDITTELNSFTMQMHQKQKKKYNVDGTKPRPARNDQMCEI